MKLIEYALFAVVLSAFANNYVWIRRLKAAIAEVHPHHPEIDQFRSFGTPLHLVTNLMKFRMSRALFDLPGEERKVLYLLYRFQLFILLSFLILVIYVVGFLLA
ncbi:hypothetical protein [uncultured Pseudoxanthomonas sp.]|uniref:hypothetical protein n=1 Tax=uncultured Pseudoxanthomonas sp. TaxID=281701 RepID=UPI00261BC25F|nr:hypothetical protein [uncultured Pseudoxanthomonas sp.]